MCGCTDLKEMLEKSSFLSFWRSYAKGNGGGAQVCGRLTIMQALSVGVI